MKKLTLFTFVLGLFLSTAAVAQISDPHTAFKKHINEVVQQVEQTESPEEKRALLNNSLTDLVETIEQVENKENVPAEDKAQLAAFKNDLMDKKAELNGEAGFTQVPANQLNNFANFVQQDIEQADRVVTLSLTSALLIVLILLLL